MKKNWKNYLRTSKATEPKRFLFLLIVGSLWLSSCGGSNGGPSGSPGGGGSSANTCTSQSQAGDLCTPGTQFVTSQNGKKYMTTLSGCYDTPEAQLSHPGLHSDYDMFWATGAFTPIECTGSADFVYKAWSGGRWNENDDVFTYDIPSMPNYENTEGTAYGGVNTDSNSGAYNTNILAAITSYSQGGYHPAARYCANLVWEGFDDWYLPNRYELNMLYQAKAVLNLDTDHLGIYWSSTESAENSAWVQHMDDGDQYTAHKNFGYLIRCIRQF